MPSTERIGLGEKLGYGLGDTASNLYFQFFNLFLLYYYTDVMELNAASVGTMYLVANLWDAVNDPMMGALADRVRTKQGTYRPFLLWFALPYGILGWLMFLNPDLGEVGRLAFAYVTFIGFKMVYTAINVPYSALMGVMTDDDGERVALSTFRFLGAFGGGFVVSLLVRPLVGALGGGSEVLGFQRTMGVFGLASVVMFLLTWAATRERLPPPDAGKTDLSGDLRMLLSSRPWWVMVAAAVCTLSAVAVRGAVTVHYFKYYVGHRDAPVFTLGDPTTPWHLAFDLTTVFLASGSLAFLVGVALTQRVDAMLGKRNGLVVLTLANAVTVLGFFFLPPQATTAMFAVNLLGNLLAGPTPALVWALYADVADHCEWQHGRRATGLVFSGAMFAQKFGLTVGGAGAGWLLAAVGFVANVEQTETALLGIRWMFCIVPGALGVANGLVLMLYPLSREGTTAMQAELATRRGRSSS